MTVTASKYERIDNEAYFTPAWPVHALLSAETFTGGFWDSGAGLESRPSAIVHPNIASKNRHLTGVLHAIDLVWVLRMSRGGGTYFPWPECPAATLSQNPVSAGVQFHSNAREGRAMTLYTNTMPAGMSRDSRAKSSSYEVLA